MGLARTIQLLGSELLLPALRQHLQQASPSAVVQLMWQAAELATLAPPQPVAKPLGSLHPQAELTSFNSNLARLLGTLCSCLLHPSEHRLGVELTPGQQRRLAAHLLPALPRVAACVEQVMQCRQGLSEIERLQQAALTCEHFGLLAWLLVCLARPPRGSEGMQRCDAVASTVDVAAWCDGASAALRALPTAALLAAQLARSGQVRASLRSVPGIAGRRLLQLARMTAAAAAAFLEPHVSGSAPAPRRADCEAALPAVWQLHTQACRLTHWLNQAGQEGATQLWQAGERPSLEEQLVPLLLSFMAAHSLWHCLQQHRGSAVSTRVTSAAHAAGEASTDATTDANDRCLLAIQAAHWSALHAATTAAGPGPGGGGYALQAFQIIMECLAAMGGSPAALAWTPTMEAVARRAMRHPPQDAGARLALYRHVLLVCSHVRPPTLAAALLQDGLLRGLVEALHGMLGSSIPRGLSGSEMLLQASEMLLLGFGRLQDLVDAAQGLLAAGSGVAQQAGSAGAQEDANLQRLLSTMRDCLQEIDALGGVPGSDTLGGSLGVGGGAGSAATGSGGGLNRQGAAAALDFDGRVTRHMMVALAGERPAGALHSYWQLPVQQTAAAEAYSLAEVGAGRACAFLKCPNLGAAGGPAARQGEGSRRCSVCRVVWYCNEQCQLGGWRTGHKLFCRLLGAARERERQRQAQVGGGGN
ncbi:hypothetical protein ABPG75_011557 [Micractinium tetrahymenae]